MSPVTAPGARHGLALVLAAGLLDQPAAAAPDNTPPALPASVTASQEQLGRWVAAFNGWRSAKKTWSEETDPEAQLRGQTRLLILPTPTPLVSRQRGLDGRAIVVSSGLIALLDELSLAAGAPDPSCLRTYGGHVLATLTANRPTLPGRFTEAPAAWARLTTLAEAGKAGLLGQPYPAGLQAEKPGNCSGVTAHLARSPATRASQARQADAVAFWLFTQQHLQLARLPSLEKTKSDAGTAASASASASAVAPDKAARQKPESSGKPTVADQMRVQVNVQVRVDIPAGAGAPATAASAGADSTKAVNERAQKALGSVGWPENLPVVAWLQKHLPLLDAGSSPPVPAASSR